MSNTIAIINHDGSAEIINLREPNDGEDISFGQLILERKPAGVAIAIEQDGPLLGTKFDARWDGFCHRTIAGVDVTKWLPDASKGIHVEHAYKAIEAACR